MQKKNKEYKVELIRDNAIYANKTARRQLQRLYYFVFWKNYLEAKITDELTSAIMYFCKMIDIFYKDHPKKLTATFLFINPILPITKPSTKPFVKILKQKQG